MNFVKRVVRAAKNHITRFFEMCIKHTEAIVVLTLSAVGLNALLGELPFYYALPMWIEAPLVIPVLSVVAISLLMKSAELRVMNRQPQLLAVA